MGNNFYKGLGAAFLFVAAILYTSERIVEKLAAAIVAAGHASAGMGTDRAVAYDGFFANFFVWFFALIGFLLLAYGFPKDK